MFTQIAGRHPGKLGDVDDIEIVAREVSDHRSEICGGAELVVTRIGKREFGGVARGAHLEGVVLDRAAAALQLIDGIDIAAEPVDIGLGLDDRALGPHQIEVCHRDIEDNLRAHGDDAEPGGLGGIARGAQPRHPAAEIHRRVIERKQPAGQVRDW